MSFHRNAKLGLAGRYALVCAIEGGMSLKQAAAAFSVSPATAHRPADALLPVRPLESTTSLSSPTRARAR